MKKFLKILKYILLFLVIFLICLSASLTKWALDNFSFGSFDEILFQLTSPIIGTSHELILSLINNSLLVALCLTVFIFLIYILIFKYLSCNSLEFNIKFFKKKHDFTVNTKILKIGIVCMSIFIYSLVIYTCLDKIYFISYIKNATATSSFIEDNYVSPKDVKLTFPDKKRNLIYIFVESFESTYFSKDLGGESTDNYLEPLNELTASNVNFSDSDKFGGAYSVNGTTWTSAAIVSNTAGIPLKMNFNSFSLNKLKNNYKLNGAYTLGDILKDNGYNQEFMIGSDKRFGNRDAYLSRHGNYDIFDYNTAKEKKLIDSDYYVWWGYEDTKLFEYAKDEIIRLSKEDKPFNFSLLTVNTHPVDGYLEESCKNLFDSDYENAIYCSANQLADFVSWIQEQDFYFNTSIVIVGDHISMQPDLYPEDVDRRVYNLFINSAVTGDNYKERQFSTMDYFPTVLAALGVSIEGDRLGLGTNLFSNKKTLIEENGLAKFDEEIIKYSPFYNKEFAN